MAQEFVAAKLRGDKVVVFMKPTCSYCIMARDVLSKYKFKPGHLECIDISGRSDMGSMQDYFLEITGARTVPRVFIGEECVGGGSDVAELDQSGKLEAMLQCIGALQ
ncbi:glutaredoxin-1 [Myripristis murdjan]|uniref:Glutaredoxin (thioltransferase) n=1 Tax=Myripristis murdjan TaxID=586833 RepID=A0A667WHG4_9TELE|nr:glutaredoxin-1 [Myripristis murdjan]